MPKKPQIPDALTIVYCLACHKPMNGRGWYGPGCQCEVEQRRAQRAAHPIGTARTNWG